MTLNSPKRLDEMETQPAGLLVPLRPERALELQPEAEGASDTPLDLVAPFPVLGPHNVAAVIPAYQAEPWIAEVARSAADQVHRVLVVDDGSTDGTQEQALRVGGAVEVTRLDENLGKGAALRHGFMLLMEEPTVEAIITLDADGQHRPTEMPKLLEGADEADLVLGCRSHLFGSMFWLRRLANTTSARLISLAAGRPLRDVQTGFRLYRRRLLERLPLAEDGFEAESAVVVRAARQGYRIESVSIDLAEVDGRSTSHYRPLVDSLRILLGVVAARALGPVDNAGRKPNSQEKHSS